MDVVNLAGSFLSAQEYQGNDGYGLRFWKGDFYRYRNKHYKKISLDDFTNQINGWLSQGEGLKDRVGSALIPKLITAIKIYCKVPDDLFWPLYDYGQDGPQDDCGYKPTPTYLAFQNGILNVDEYLNRRGKNETITKHLLLPHSENFLSFNVLPFDFDPQAQCPIYDQMISEIMPDQSTIDMWHEWCGNHFNFSRPIDKFMILSGEGANGKSVLLNILKELLGADNVSHVSLNSFQPEHFALGETFGKLANICAEMNDLERVNEATLKAYVTRDPMTMNQKYRAHFTFIPQAKLTFATNTLPTFTDKTDGLWRRLLLIELKNQFHEDRQKPEYLQSSYWQGLGELSGIFNHAIEGLCRIIKQGQLTKSESTKESVQQYRLDVNPIAHFFGAQLELDTTESLTMECIFEHYNEWCQRSGYNLMNFRNFTRAFWSSCRTLQVKVEQERTTIKGSKKRMARGVKLKLDLN